MLVNFFTLGKNILFPKSDQIEQSKNIYNKQLFTNFLLDLLDRDGNILMKTEYYRTILTGYLELSSPVLLTYISLKTSSAASASPHSSKNFGLSGKKNNQSPMSILGIAQAATNKFQLANLKPCDSRTKSMGIIIHAIPEKNSINDILKYQKLQIDQQPYCNKVELFVEVKKRYFLPK